MRRGPLLCFILLSSFLWGACERESILPSPSQTVIPEGVIPSRAEGLPRVFITSPRVVDSRDEWTSLATIRIQASVDGKDTLVYQADSLMIKGRGHTTWSAYPKKPYALKLNHKANLLGLGEAKRWVLLANWMDRTLLRNQVALEAARRTSLSWTPSGIFVELYMNDPETQSDTYQGIYWLGDKIQVHKTRLSADYLYCFDSSEAKEQDYTAYCHFRKDGEWQTGDVPVTLKYPDKDDYPGYYWTSYLKDQSLAVLQGFEDAIYHLGSGAWAQMLDLDSFCDWLLVNELCGNMEARSPKSCYFSVKDGILYAGPVWDFDYETFKPYTSVPKFKLRSSLYYFQIFAMPEFKTRLKSRWRTLKPSFATLPEYIDAQAALLAPYEARNFGMWPCFPNPLSEDKSGFVNGDEKLSYQEAVDRMKEALLQRLSDLDELIRNI